MLFNTVAGLASLAFVTVDAAPAPTARADFGSLKDCTDLSISGAWMIGTCPADDGHKVKSTIWLGTKVTNNGGSLGWKVDGNYGPSCDDCKVIGGSSLNCQCHILGRETGNTTLNLDEHVHNYNGHILSDLSGTPKVPADSSVPVPTDFSWSLTTANSRCYSLDPTTDAEFCGKDIVESSCEANSASFTSGGAPVRCYSNSVPVSASFQMYNEYEKLMVKSASKAIEFLAYDNKDCSGTPFATVKPEDDDTCKVFSRTVRGLAYKPLWNAEI